MIDEQELERLRHREYDGDPVVKDLMDTLEAALRVVRAAKKARKELGVPQPGYPTPVSNAYNFLHEALAPFDGPVKL